MIFLVILAFTAGLFVKYADMLSDSIESSSTSKTSILIGIIYGFLISVTIFLYPVVTALCVGSILGLVIAGKIDSFPHWAGIVTIAIAFLMMLFTDSIELSLNMFEMLIFFAFVCICEEYLHDYFSVRKDIIGKISAVRPMLEIAAISVSVVTGEWLIWLALVSHDIGYCIVSKIEKK